MENKHRNMHYETTKSDPTQTNTGLIIIPFEMSSFDTPNEMAVKYPNEKQKNYAWDVMRSPGLASHVKLYTWCEIYATISSGQAHFVKVRLEYVLVFIVEQYCQNYLLNFRRLITDNSQIKEFVR